MATLSQLVPVFRERMENIARDTFTEVAARTYERTPIDTGMLQASWTASVNSFNFSNTGGGDFSAIDEMILGDRLTLANAQPYCRVIEYTGHSLQAPDGMMWISVAEWKQIVDGFF